MIVAALIAAEPVLRLSDSIEDPKEYLHVTDSVIEDIERSKDPVSRDCLRSVMHNGPKRLILPRPFLSD